MKTIIKAMDSLREKLESTILDREEVYNNRTERWQESEKGETYQERTDRLQEMLDELMEWQEELEQ